MIGVSPGQLIDRDRKRRTESALLNTVAVVATVFAVGFVFATQNRWRPVVDAALGRYPYYDVLLPQSVGEGIDVNSRVLFNGIDIGAVQNLLIYPNDTRVNMARVVISNNVPIRTDSAVEVRPARDGQGRLIISIGTGSPEFPLLPGSDGQGVPPRLIAIFGNDAQAFMDRASIYEREDDRAHAIADYSEAIRLDPNLAFAYRARASVYDMVGDTAAALVDYDRAIELEPANGGYLAAGCRARADWGEQLDQALAQCDAALRSRPENAETLRSRGLVHLRRGEFQAAFADYDAAIRANADLTEALYGRGLARLRLGQSEAGRADVATATARDQHVASRYAEYGLTP
jgi:tetratricopeptide (TPR) repeat protein